MGIEHFLTAQGTGEACVYGVYEGLVLLQYAYIRDTLGLMRNCQ